MRRAASLVALALLVSLAAPAHGNASEAAATLRGTVGPGFTITLKTSRGARVTKLRAGTYTIRVGDRSPIHNFHLFGPGVNEKTSVQNTGGTTWTVRLKAGLYHYRCDPHRTIMHGSFRVS